MADFSAKDVQRLRQTSGAGMMDAKKALVENDGNFDEAAKWLRERGMAKAQSRSDRKNSEGLVAVLVDGGVAAAVELKCETDFVAKSDRFIAMGQELVALVAADGTDAVSGKTSELEDMKISLKENIELGRIVRFAGDEGDGIEAYVHLQNGRGVNAVLVRLGGGSAETARDIAMHAAFTRPRYVRRDEVPAEIIDTERNTLLTLSRNEGKPEQALDKIVDGRMNGWFKEHTLLDQKWVKDEKQTIQTLLGDADILEFCQIEIGG